MSIPLLFIIAVAVDYALVCILMWVPFFLYEEMQMEIMLLSIDSLICCVDIGIVLVWHICIPDDYALVLAPVAVLDPALWLSVSIQYVDGLPMVLPMVLLLVFIC